MILQRANNNFLQVSLAVFFMILSLFSCKSQPQISQNSSSFQPSEVDSMSSSFEFHNFFAQSKNAKRGLELIYQGRGFRPNGIPLAAVQKMYKLRPLIGFGDIDLVAGRDQLKIYGKPPSPPTRTGGLGENGEDYSLVNSIVEIGLCVDEKTKQEGMAILPLDEFGDYSHCQGTGGANSKLITTKVYQFNCFTCHAGILGNQVIAGSHSNHVDEYAVAMDLGLLAENLDPEVEGRFSWMSKVALPDLSRLRRELAREVLGMSDFDKRALDRFLDYAITQLVPTFKWAKTKGDNIGSMASYKGIGLLKPDGDISRTYSRTEFSPTDSKVFNNNRLRLPSVDANPWWNLKFKNYIFWTGDEAALSARQFIYAFTLQHDGMGLNPEEHTNRLATVLTYAQELHSPKYPKEVDWDLVEKGRQIFHEKGIEERGGIVCANCHGAYTQTEPHSFKWQVDYPGVITGPIDVGTDKEYAKISHHVTKGIQPLIKEVYNAIVKKRGKEAADQYAPSLDVAGSSGTMPPPLVGLWASAPYLHNGSVPTVYEVLKAKRRPNIWTRPSHTAASISWDRLGFRYPETSSYDSQFEQKGQLNHANQSILRNERDEKNKGKYFESQATSMRSIYFSDDYGHGNQGHDFVQDWSDEDIYAIIEFLKTVSGDQVLPKDPSQGIDFSAGVLP